MNPTELFRLILNLIRKGAVIAVDHDNEVCRVECGELQTNWIRWISLAAGETRDWNPPTVGEQVLVLSAGGDMADGIVLRGISSADVPAPSHTPSAHTRTYPDGARIEYDHASHALAAALPDGATVLLTAPGSVTVKTANATVEADQVLVKASTITLDAPTTKCTGDLAVAGTVKADVDVLAGNISLAKHPHSGVKSGGDKSGGPLP
ncbi:MAG: phage baseplate assembly protein V [Duganella sp.]